MNAKYIFCFILGSCLYACNTNPYDAGYTHVTQDNATSCVPDYVTGINDPEPYGTKFYHDDFSLIYNKNGRWTDQLGEPINLKK